MEEVLVYVNFICKNIDGTFEYELLFSDTPNFVWGPFWDEYSPRSNGDIKPDDSTYTKTKRLITTKKLKTAEETTCHSMEYATYGILGLAWIDLDVLDEYPENGRCVLMFGDTYNEVLDKISKQNWSIK